MRRLKGAGVASIVAVAAVAELTLDCDQKNIDTLLNGQRLGILMHTNMPDLPLHKPPSPLEGEGR